MNVKTLILLVAAVVIVVMVVHRGAQSVAPMPEPDQSQSVVVTRPSMRPKGLGARLPAPRMSAAEAMPDAPVEAVGSTNLAALHQSQSPEERRQWLDALKQSDPDNAMASYLSALQYFRSEGQTVQSRLDELARRREAIKELGRQSEAVMKSMSDTDLVIYFDRLKMSGEESALRWALSRQDRP